MATELQLHIEALDALPVLLQIDAFVKDALANQDGQAFINAAHQLLSLKRISGIALAKILYYMHHNWESFAIETPLEEVIEGEIGFSITNYIRYVGVWDLFAQNIIPETCINSLLNFPIEKLIPIANMIRQGYVLELEEWEQLSHTTSVWEVRDHIREMTGKAPRKDTVLLSLDKEGNVFAFYQEERHFVGFLDRLSLHPVVIKAVDRIVNHTGISTNNL